MEAGLWCAVNVIDIKLVVSLYLIDNDHLIGQELTCCYYTSLFQDVLVSEDTG